MLVVPFIWSLSGRRAGQNRAGFLPLVCTRPTEGNPPDSYWTVRNSPNSASQSFLYSPSTDLFPGLRGAREKGGPALGLRTQAGTVRCDGSMHEAPAQRKQSARSCGRYLLRLFRWSAGEARLSNDCELESTVHLGLHNIPNSR